MGKKESLQKEIDAILAKLKFWRNSILAVISGMVALIFSISQNKIDTTSVLIEILFISGVCVIIVLGYYIKRDENKMAFLIEELKKEE